MPSQVHPPYLTFTSLKVMAALTLPAPDPRGHHGGSLSRMSGVRGGGMSRTLAWLVTQGWATWLPPFPPSELAELETGQVRRTCPFPRRYVRLTDDGHRYFERRRARMFIPDFGGVSPAPLFPFTAGQPRDTGPQPDAGWEARAQAWDDADRQAYQALSERRSLLAREIRSRPPRQSGRVMREVRPALVTALVTSEALVPPEPEGAVSQSRVRRKSARRGRRVKSVRRKP